MERRRGKKMAEDKTRRGSIREKWVTRGGEKTRRRVKTGREEEKGKVIRQTGKEREAEEKE